VYFVVIVDLVQTGFTTFSTYEYLVQYWGILAITAAPPKVIVVGPICASIVATAAHSFFVWRIYILSGMNIFAIITCVAIMLVSFCQMIGDFVGCGLFLHDGTSFAALHRTTSAFTVWLAGSLAADVMIAIAMLVILQMARKRTSFKDTSDLITKLSRVAIQTGLVTAVCALVQLTLFLRFNNNDLHQTFAFILGKLYTNSLLGNLNSRRSIVSSAVSSSDHGTYLWSAQNNSQILNSRSIELHSRLKNQTTSGRTATTVNVDRQVYTYDDDAYKKTGLSSINPETVSYDSHHRQNDTLA